MAGQQQPQSAFQRLAQGLRILRCLWLREMSCPVLLHAAYITKHRAMDPGGINRRKAIT